MKRIAGFSAVRRLLLGAMLCVAVCAPARDDIARYDPYMAVADVATGGLQWIDGEGLPIEGRAFDDTELYYDRLPSNITAKVNAGVRNRRHTTAGMQFRFATDSRKLVFKWVPYSRHLSMDHMPATGVSGIDVYRFDAGLGGWEFVKGGRIRKANEGVLEVDWRPGEACLVNLPLYNGIKEFKLGMEPGAAVRPAPPRKNGVTKPVVFYGTSITQGACASRPGMSFVNIVGRNLDVPVVNLGFSGSGVMELEMSEHLARIDASCYVLDCLWNMGTATGETANAAGGRREGRNVEENYEPFIRNLRAKRPDVPIVMAGQCFVYGGASNAKERYVETLYRRLVSEGWKKLHFLPGKGMYGKDRDGSVEGIHPNDWGMMHLARAYSHAVKEALSD